MAVTSHVGGKARTRGLEGALKALNLGPAHSQQRHKYQGTMTEIHGIHLSPPHRALLRERKEDAKECVGDTMSTGWKTRR